MPEVGRGPRLVRIPRHLLHVTLDDLESLGVTNEGRSALAALLADLPLVPGAANSALLLGAPAQTLPCLAVLARHVGQSLRDHNVALMHDRNRLRVGRKKLAFLAARGIEDGHDTLLAPLSEEAVLCVPDLPAALPPRLHSMFSIRASRGLATFATSPLYHDGIPATWRRVRL